MDYDYGDVENHKSLYKSSIDNFVHAQKLSSKEYSQRQESYHKYFRESIPSFTSQIINMKSAPSVTETCSYCGSAEPTCRCLTCLKDRCMCSSCAGKHLDTAIFHRVGKTLLDYLVICSCGYLLFSYLIIQLFNYVII